MSARFKPYSEYDESGVAWIGEMPSHWGLQRTKTFFNRMQRPIREQDGIVTAFRDGEVTLRSNRRTDGFTNAAKEIGYQGVRIDDLIVHAMDGFAGAIGVSDSDGKCSPVYSVCTPKQKNKVHVAYYGYLVRQLAVTDFINSLAKGIRERSTEFRYSEFSILRLAVPPLEEQKQIASFLDYETAKIDALIEKQQLIALLGEKRQAVISHAVTKGLNPDAPMRDSGVEWLGEVPEHWAISKIKHLCYVNDGNHGEEYPKSDDYTDEEDGVPFIRGGNMQNFQIVNKGMLYITKRKNDSMRKGRLETGDVLFMNRGDIGKLALISDDHVGSNLNSQIAYLRCEKENVSNRFLLYFLASDLLRSHVESLKMGSVLTQFPIADIVAICVPLPDVNEQRQIVTHIELRLEKLDSLVGKAEASLELLQERRTALISAAVTGKIDVRNWKPPTDDKPQRTNKEVA